MNLENGADVHDADADNSDGYTPLHCAALGGHADCINALLAARADPAAESHSSRQGFLPIMDFTDTFMLLIGIKTIKPVQCRSTEHISKSHDNVRSD